MSSGGLGYNIGYDATEKKVMDSGDDEAKVVVLRPVERKDSMELSFLNNENEKSPVSARFAHRKTLPHSLGFEVLTDKPWRGGAQTVK